MATNQDFDKFINNINPSKTTISEVSSLQNNLREYLKQSSYSHLYFHSYLSGSYAKHTFIRPKTDDSSSDVDIVIETTHTTCDNSTTALAELACVLKRKEKYSNLRVQSHSIGIEMAKLHVDVVPLAHEDSGILYIGSSKCNHWSPSNPKVHIEWSNSINNNSGGRFKDLVKIFKWWRQENCPTDAKFPKGIVLEKLIADAMQYNEISTEALVIQTMESLSSLLVNDYSDNQIPFISDPAFPENNMAKDYTSNDFLKFVETLQQHLALLNTDTSNSTWQKILGEEFPSGGQTLEASGPDKIHAQKAALNVPYKQVLGMKTPKRPNAIITAEVTLPNGRKENLDNDAEPIPKNSKVLYKVFFHPVRGKYLVKWQVTNTGPEAERASCLRGNFERPNKDDNRSREESTAYAGKHFVQCFIIQKNQCKFMTQPFFINVSE